LNSSYGKAAINKELSSFVNLCYCPICTKDEDIDVISLN